MFWLDLNFKFEIILAGKCTVGAVLDWTPLQIDIIGAAGVTAPLQIIFYKRLVLLAASKKPFLGAARNTSRLYK
jgi:hypothetical protein